MFLPPVHWSLYTELPHIYEPLSSSYSIRGIAGSFSKAKLGNRSLLKKKKIKVSSIDMSSPTKRKIGVWQRCIPSSLIASMEDMRHLKTKELEANT